MRIALNMHFLRPDIGGGKTYGLELARALARVDQSNEYLLICNRAWTELELPHQKNFQIVPSPVKPSRRLIRYAWEQLVIPGKLRQQRVDVVHSMGYVAPLLAPGKQVVTIPDANWRDLDTMARTQRHVLGFFVSRSARAADVIITGTEAAAATLAKYLPTERGCITVVPLGANHLPSPATAELPGFEHPFLLALSGNSNHKNILRLIDAFTRISESIPHTLIIAGRVPPKTRAGTTHGTLGRRLLWVGYVDNATLSSLYAAADLFVFPSWHEGFGLPLLEAQRVGTPVAAARIAALVEIANGTAELFDPFSTDSIAHAILTVLTVPQRHEDLSRAGLRNAAVYTWEAAARATLAVYGEVVGG